MRKSQYEKEEKKPFRFPAGKEKPPREKRERAPKAPGSFKGSVGDFFRNRIVIGIICLLVSVLIAFVGVPVVQSYVSQRVPVVVAACDIEQGALITSDMLKMSDIGAADRPLNAAQSFEQVAGAYASYPFVQGDILIAPKLTRTRPVTHPYLHGLPEGKKAISVSVKGLAEGLTGKLKPGDVVSVYAAFNRGNAEENYVALQPPELTYVRVLAISNSLGSDIDVDSDTTLAESEREHLPATITLQAGEIQAAALAGIDHSATIHVALVARAENTELCDMLLAEQDLYIAAVEAANSPLEDTAEKPDAVLEDPPETSSLTTPPEQPQPNPQTSGTESGGGIDG